VKAAITGASGFIGSHLVEGFRGAGWEVRGIVRPGRTRSVPAGVPSIEAPLEAGPLTRALDGVALVVHAAGVAHAPSRAAFDATNVGGTEHLVEAANRTGTTVVFISSQAAAGIGTPSKPTREDDLAQPVTPYGRSKLAAEEAIKGAAVPWTIVRPSSVYGPRDRQFLPIFRFAKRGLFPLAANPSAAYTMIHVEDLVRGILAAAATPNATGQVVFLGHRDPVAPSDLLRAAAAAFDRPYRPWRVPMPFVHGLASLGELSWKLGHQPLIDRARAAELSAPGFVCAVERAEQILGFRAAIGVDEGVRRTAAWYREEGWI
jgi:nucleoside-diphosphate-sugar epimerase